MISDYFKIARRSPTELGVVEVNEVQTILSYPLYHFEIPYKSLTDHVQFSHRLLTDHIYSRSITDVSRSLPDHRQILFR